MRPTAIPEYILSSLTAFAPETALVAFFCVALLAATVAKKSAHVVGWVTLIGLVVTDVLLSRQGSGSQASIFSTMMAVDPFSLAFRHIILGAGILVTLFSMQSGELTRGQRPLGEYYALLLSMTVGMLLMTGASNLLMMYISLELTSLSSYVLAGYTKDAEDSSEASLKYVIYGALSSGMMLYGISILYGLTGALDLQGINHALMTGEVSTIALVTAGILTVVGFGFKISAVPFHFWTPDVYEGAPITITAYLSVASKAAGFAMMMRFFKVAFFDAAGGNIGAGTWGAIQGFDWNMVLAVLSVLTMTIGNLVAVWQNNLKRLLAYSSIAHAGYMLLGVVVMSNEGVAAVVVYFIVYLFMNLGAFYVVMIVADETGSEEIDAYKGLGRRSPVIAFALTVFLLSLTGIPPTAGFVGKLYIFAALINGKWFWLAIVGVLNSVVSLYYYVRIFRNMYLRDSGEPLPSIRVSPLKIAVLLVLLVPTLVLGLYFTPLVEYAQASISMFGVR